MKILATTIPLTFFALAGLAPAQTQPATDRALGAVTSIDAQNHGIVVKEDKGDSVTITVGDKTFLLRLPPGETDVKKAARIKFADIGVGDRLVAAGTKSGDKLEARTVMIMSKSDIAQQQQKEEEEWQKRGLNGTVASVAPEEKSFTVTVGEKKYTVTSTDKTDYRRYAADSAEYSDSKPSTLGDIKAGDQVRVLYATKDDAAATATAERVVFGTFTRVAGLITSVNAETGEIKLTDLFNKKPVTIEVTAKSTTRRLPDQMANQIAQRFKPRDDANGDGRGGRGGGFGEGRGGGRGPRNMDLSQITARLPAIPIGELKTGSAIILTGTPQADASHVTAVTIIAGIEPIVTAGAPVVRDLIGGWNLGGGGGGDEGGGGGDQ
jgi:hypothetical protein